MLRPRRREIAILITEGRTLNEIAGMLTITPEAVADHVDYILQRLDRASRAEVASWGTGRATATSTPVAYLWVVKPESRERRELAVAVENLPADTAQVTLRIPTRCPSSEQRQLSRHLALLGE